MCLYWYKEGGEPTRTVADGDPGQRAHQTPHRRAELVEGLPLHYVGVTLLEEQHSCAGLISTNAVARLDIRLTRRCVISSGAELFTVEVNEE